MPRPPVVNHALWGVLGLLVLVGCDPTPEEALERAVDARNVSGARTRA